MDTTTLFVLAAGVVVIPVIIEAFGPPGNNKAKRQIGTILSATLAVAVAMLEAQGVPTDGDSLTLIVVAGVVAKVGGQAMHDGYWRDKDIPSARRLDDGDGV